LPREREWAQARGDAMQEQANPLKGFEQRDAGAGDEQQDDQHAVRPEMAEIIEMIGTLPEGIEHQEGREEKHAAREQALHP